MTEESQSTEPPIGSRDWFLRDASKMFACENNPYVIAAHYINRYKNASTALAVMFGLSWATNRDYLHSLVKYFNENFDMKTQEATPDWLYIFANHYVTEVSPLPGT
jgi:hypothetical protein